MRAPDPVLLFDRAAVEALLTLEECIAAVESAFAAHASGNSLRPGLLHVDADGGEFHVKAGGLRQDTRDAGRTYFAAKINGGFFENRARYELPNILGLILLSDGRTGAPLALMESGYITRLRTAAATAVAAKYLARPDSHSVIVFGSGAQAAIQLRAVARVAPIRRAFIYSRNAQSAGELAERIRREMDVDAKPVATSEHVAICRVCDIIVTTTPARSWILGRGHVRPGAFIAAVGADSPEKQELEPALVGTSSLVCDLTEQCAQVGELHHAIAAGVMTRSDVHGELGQVITGQVRGRRHAQETIVFDSTGTALQDVAAAAAVYEKAIAAGHAARFAFHA